MASLPDDKLAKAFESASKIAKSDLPVIAPALWKDRSPGITAVEFFREHYTRYIAYGLTRSYLLELDRPLYRTLSTWLLRQATVPPDLHFLLEVRRDAVDAELAAAGIEDPHDVRRAFRDDPRKADRLYEAAKARAEKTLRPKR